MLTVNQITKTYGIETVLDHISFSINPGERFALVGPNGSGKSTLIKILSGYEKPDSGCVTYNPPDLRLGYLPQGYTFSQEMSVATFLSTKQGEVDSLSRLLETTAMQVAQNPGLRELQESYDRILADLQLAFENVGKVEKILSGLGLNNFPPDMPFNRLSGGQKTRFGLARILLDFPQVLLLDEPTNHLDIDMLEWLETWLQSFTGALLVVSHDRAFVDAVATDILEIDPITHAARQFVGNYSAYIEQKEAETQRQWQVYSDQQEEISRLEAASRHLRGIARFHKGGKADTNDGFAKGFFANRGTKTIARAKNIERRLEKLLVEEKIEKPRPAWQMKIDFGGTAASGKDIVALESLTVGYGEKVILKDLSGVVRNKTRVALIGPNGSGKTTLLRTIAGEIPPLGGYIRIGSSVHLGYMAQEQEVLNPEHNALETIREIASLSVTNARAMLSLYLFKGDDVFIPVGQLSYGERARLMLACLVAQGCNFLILDEPVNHLDIPSRARFEGALAVYEGAILAVSHDRYFIESFATEIWQVGPEGIRITRLVD